MRRGTGAPGRGGMPVPGGCRRQSKNEDSHKDVDVQAPRRIERIASVLLPAVAPKPLSAKRL